ncbi:MAG: hypothetical protein OEL55_04140 [Desulfobulbaceae bacterium]|nr:hypothetical protein [Desulfobulbaceae bacterium]
MHTILKKTSSLICWAALCAAVCIPLTANADQTPIDNIADIHQNIASKDGNYSSLTLLVNDICSDAILRFNGFFTPSDVAVHPFKIIDHSPRETSILGVVLADQMLAMINNETSGRFAKKHGPGENQELTGLIQEMDGYLRIHITGRNEQGEKRSHVVAVEMSEPLYRALHATTSLDN